MRDHPPGSGVRLMSGRTWRYSRKLVQIAVLVLMLSPLAGLGMVAGTFSASRIFGITLADPFAMVQVLLAAKKLTLDFFLAGLVVMLFYGLVGGRIFCGWVCPVNTLLEYADQAVARPFTTGGQILDRRFKYRLLVLLLGLSFLAGLPVFELISPIGLLMRSLLFGANLGLLVIAAILLFDLFYARRGWCRSLCPVGAAYAIIGAAGRIRVKINHASCTKCGHCLANCLAEPELWDAIKNHQPLVKSPECTNCGECLDACPHHALAMGWLGRSDQKPTVCLHKG